MYKCFKMRKFIILSVCDMIMIVTALIVTLMGTAYNEKEEKVFLPIIMYHSIVGDDDQGGDYQVRVSVVEQDLAYLKKNGYTAVFVEDVVNYVKNNKSLPEKPVIITADDGFYNNYYYLLPLLEKYDMKATISVVGYYSEVIAAKDPHIPQYSYLTWEDISKLLESGRVEIGNHTYNMHSLSERCGCEKLSFESEGEYVKKLNEDIGLMQTLIKMNTGVSPTVFAYPFGIISKESIPVLKELGFTAALNCIEKPNYISHDESCLFTLNRYNRPDGISTEEFMSRFLKN